MLKIGQPQPRFEDNALIRGRGRYTGDCRAENEAALVFVRSPAAAGRLVEIDVSAAKEMPGVIAVLTAQDLVADGIKPLPPRLRHPGPDGGEMRVPRAYPLATDAVRYLGEPVAVVLAETRAVAEDAADAVGIDVEDWPVVVDCADAIAPDAPRVWQDFPDNRCFRYEQGDAAAVDAAIRSARHVVRQRLRLSRVTAVAMEPRNVLAAFEDGRYRLELGTQSPHRMAGDLCPALGVAADAIRVVGHDCGGSFGMKNAGYAEYVVALWAARRLGRPVRWTSTRLESFQADAHARDQWVDAALALDEEGRFLALRVHAIANLGAFLGPATPHSPTNNIGGMAGVYRTPNIHVVVEGVFTNTQHTATYRGAGRPEATYVIERMIDIAAGEIGIDRAELRRRNLIAPEQMPYKTGLLFTYDSGDFPAVLDRALAAADWAGFEARRSDAKQRGRLRGIGIANPIEIAGGPAAKPSPEYARLELSGGNLRMLVGSCDAGQGHGTAFRQLIGERLGLAAGAVELVAGDTGLVTKGMGTFGSRTISAAGAMILKAADEIVERLKDRAAEMLESAPGDLVFEERAYRIAGTDRAITFEAVAATQSETVSAEAFEGNQGPTFPNGCHVCEVEIDPETGHVSVESYFVIDDVGTVINPLLVKGQIAGGVAQGVGQALFENAVYAADSGQLLSATFMDYAMPRAGTLPGFGIESLPVPTAQNPLGAKGVGEAGTVGALAAAISAVCDALAPAGVRHLDMPATPQRVWQALHGQKC